MKLISFYEISEAYKVLSEKILILFEPDHPLQISWDPFFNSPETFRFKVAIDNLEFCCMDPDMEHHYKELLHQWKNDEDNIKDELKEISTDVKGISTDVKEMKELTKKLDNLVASTLTPEVQSSNEGEYVEAIRDFINQLWCIQKRPLWEKRNRPKQQLLKLIWQSRLFDKSRLTGSWTMVIPAFTATEGAWLIKGGPFISST